MDCFHKLLFKVICNKVREGEQRIVRIKEGDPRGRHVVIVDDLVQSGSTLIECQVKELSMTCFLYAVYSDY
jgi:phosphoribosylpyrophosphate synthetase